MQKILRLIAHKVPSSSLEPRYGPQHKDARQNVPPHGREDLGIPQRNLDVSLCRLRQESHNGPHDARRGGAPLVEEEARREEHRLGRGEGPEEELLAVLELRLELGLRGGRQGVGGSGAGEGGALALDLCPGEGCEDHDVETETERDERVEETPEVCGRAPDGGGRLGGLGYGAGHAGEGRGRARGEPGAGHELGHHLHHGVLVEAAGGARGGSAIAALEAEHHLAELFLGDGGLRRRGCIAGGSSALGLVVVVRDVNLFGVGMVC